jgi:hypothetical protein
MYLIFPPYSPSYTLSLYPPPRLYFYLFIEIVSCVAQAGLKFAILLPEPLECWNYRRLPVCAETPESLLVLGNALKGRGGRKATNKPEKGWGYWVGQDRAEVPAQVGGLAPIMALPSLTLDQTDAAV